MQADSNQTYNSEYAALYDITVQHRDTAVEISTLEAILKSRPKSLRGKILDIGCGTGNHAIGLAKKGYSVTGIDISAPMIQQARAKSSGIPFHVSSLENFEEGNFDFCYMMGNAINCLPGFTALLAFLKKVFEKLSLGGAFLFECWNPIALIAEPPVTLTRTYETEEFRIVRTVTPKPRFFEQEIDFEYDIHATRKPGGESSEFKIIHETFLFTPREMTEAARFIGFLKFQVKSGLADLKEADASTRVISILCEKHGNPPSEL